MFCNWISRVSDGGMTQRIKSWLMQRLNTVADTRLYTGRRQRVMILSSSLLTRKTFWRFSNCSTQTSLCEYKMFKARHLSFKKKCNCTVREMKTKALVNTQLICAFVFASVNNEFSHNAAPMRICLCNPRNTLAIF